MGVLAWIVIELPGNNHTFKVWHRWRSFRQHLQKTIHGLDMVAIMPILSKANEETSEAAEIVHKRHKNLRELWLQGQEGEKHGHHHHVQPCSKWVWAQPDSLFLLELQSSCSMTAGRFQLHGFDCAQDINNNPREAEKMA